MADEVKTCANCGHTQATGDYCEACGTKLAVAGSAAVEPAVAAPVAAAVAQPAPAAVAAAAPSPPPSVAPVQADLSDKGFWSRFFDLKFSSYITPSVIRVLFILFMVVIGLSVIGGIINGFLWSPGLGIFALIGGIIWGFVSLLLARVFLEVVIVFFHIHDNTREIAKSKR